MSSQQPAQNQLPANADASDVRRILFQGLDEVRSRFEKEFTTEIGGLIDRLTWAYTILRREESTVPGTERSGHTFVFLWVSFKSLLDSAYLLISGMPVPAGNLMRQFCESIIMALLSSHPGIDLLEVYIRDMRGFKIKLAHRYMRRPEILELLNIDPELWKGFMRTTAWHHQHSHLSAETAADLFLLREGGGMKLLGEFDEYRLEGYRKDLLLRSSAAERLGELVQSTARRLRDLQPRPEDG